MAKKKKDDAVKHGPINPNVEGLHAEVVETPISDTLQENFMPYAMSIIVSRAIPEIDGFKPSHRKLLYTMYKMGLLTGGRTKSANIVGQTMKLNPHGDAAIYETMVRLSRGCEALLHPLVDSKGNFGKVYSRDMAYAASRYTEAKLEPICAEVFRDIDHDAVDFVDNYDSTMKEPSLLPTAFPNVLVSANTGIAAGMASNICSFNLSEVCKTAVALIKNPSHDVMETLIAPDFPTGGEILYDRSEMAEIYATGRGSFKVRSRWRYIKEENLIEIYEIPYTTTTEAIIDKVSELIKAGKVKEIADMRDETDLSGLKLAIDLKRGVDPDKLMQRLFARTPLCDSYPCNFNILIAGMPRVMGVSEILGEWLAWRTECIRRRAYHSMNQKSDKLHLLKGLGKILLDIDRAIRIIRETETDAEVVPNLMIAFGIDQIQANFVAEIKLRNINKEYILRRVEETESLEKEIADLKDLIGSQKRLRSTIASELESIDKKYGAARKTGLVYDHELEVSEPEDETPDYQVTYFLSQEGYFKKITPLSLRMSSEQKFKEGDSLSQSFEGSNRDELLFFTNQYQVYKAHGSDFADTKASVLGDFIPGKLDMDEGERVVYLCRPESFTGSLLFIFENGKIARVDASCYETKTNRKKLTGAYSDKSPLVRVMYITEECELVLYSTENRAIIVNTAQLAVKSTRATQGVNVMTLKPKYRLRDAAALDGSSIVNAARYRARSLPAAGALLKPEDMEEKQLTLGLE